MQKIAFVGGGNMASAIVAGLVGAGSAGGDIVIVEPNEAQRQSLADRFGVTTLPAAAESLAEVGLVVWAVKPQLFRSAAQPCAPYVSQALHLSVMAGIRSDTIAAAIGSERVVRAMPNTPALIGQGIAGLFARAAVSEADRARVEVALAPTGELVWVESEAALDAVTALSGSGPAYVFHVLEAMIAAGREMGLGDVVARRLAVQTVAGAAALAAASPEPLEVLRRNVTSPGGTTEAGVAWLDGGNVRGTFIAAIRAAHQRAQQLGDEFGRG